jgi:formate C-acetyltransferase
MESNRIEKLKETVLLKKYPICIEKIRLITEVYKEMEGEPTILKRAKAIAKVLDNITIFIEDGEIIVGNAASKQMGVEIDYWFGPWPEKEIDGLIEDEGWGISEAERAELKSLNEYWKDKTWFHGMGLLFDDERLWPFMQSGIAQPPWKSRDEGWGGGSSQPGAGYPLVFAVPDYERVLNGGLNQIILEAEEELRNTRIMSADSVKKVYFLKAVLIALKAVINYANRFAVLATELASKEDNPARKKELKRIAQTCKWVPANPARSFYEAMQSFWFIFLMVSSGQTPLGRFDQFMYPFYKKDVEEGRITDDKTLELLQCLRIKDMQLNMLQARAQREKWAGMAKWHNCTIGGQTPNGSDATNELTFLILEAAQRCPTTHHTITLRVHEATPRALMLKALEVVKTGVGMPAFVSDKSYIEYLLSQGVQLKEARDYALAGCLEANLRRGKSRIWPVNPFVVALVFDIFMHNGVEPRTGKQLGPKTGELESFKSFEELMMAWKEHLAYFMSPYAEWVNIFTRVWGDLWPDPIGSALMYDAIKEGKDYLDRKMPFENMGSMLAVGMINVADSLAAIKKLVFDEKKVSMRELKAALAANWHGDGYKEMQKMFLAAPKFGNDNDYVDSIARELYQFWADTTATFDNVFGEKFKPSAVSITTHWPGGALTGATPDGRYAGEVLADGTVSPVRGRDTHGPTAVIKSATKVDQSLYQSTLLNMKFHPSALTSTEDLGRLADLIRTYFSLGGKHIQFNIVDKETLLDAQRQPENHRDLIVRVAGYSAYFVQLGKVIQDEIIARVEHKLA